MWPCLKIYAYICVVIIIVGFALMTGDASGATEYNPDIFSFRRVTVGPMISLFGFMMMIVAILYKQQALFKHFLNFVKIAWIYR